jgi:hypothetical protein
MDCFVGIVGSCSHLDHDRDHEQEEKETTETMV